MQSTIFKKFLISYIALVALAFFCVAIFSYKVDLNKAIQNESDKLYRLAIAMAEQYSIKYADGSLNPNRLYTEYKTICTYNNSIMMLVNPDGGIIFDTYKSIIDIDASNILTDFDPASFGNRKYLCGNYCNYFSEDYLTVISPIFYNMQIRGYILVHKSMSDIKQEIDPIFNTNYITLVMCCILFSFFVLLAYCEVHKPIKKITQAVKEFGHGNLKYELKNFEDDDIGRLAAGLNYMSEKLAESETTQRQFISNVSHDFRSPLTSIKGYLEAILDGTIPYEMQNKYIGIVISETERLSKLTNNILSLNSTAANKNNLNYETFDINLKIKTIIETFEGSCKEKGITFDLTFSDKSIIVYADPDKINQVIYNLIDNAIKFSHNNSSIFIRVSQRGEKAFISVKDNGIGIPEEAQSKIWDRFYKSDLSRGKDKKGTGLGLAIVKEIIDAHKENIDVISTEGVGTEFTFSLKSVDTDEEQSG